MAESGIFPAHAANTQIKIRHSIPSHDQLPQSGPVAAEWSLARIEAAVVIVWAYVQELALSAKDLT